MAGYILKYSKGVYQAKINAMDGFIAQLNNHLQSLDTYKGQVTSFWDDENARHLLDQITDQIIKVRHAINECQKVKADYQTTVDKMAGGQAAIDDVMNDVDRSIENAGKIVGAGAGIAGIIAGG